MATERSGSCLCGKITVRLVGEPLFRSLCHCNACKKTTGVIFASNSFWREEDAQFSDPEQVSKVFLDDKPDSGHILERSFCSNCGSLVRIINKGVPGRVVVPQGIINGDISDLKPIMEFYSKRKVAWFPGVDGTKKFSEGPTSKPM